MRKQLLKRAPLTTLLTIATLTSHLTASRAEILSSQTRVPHLPGYLELEQNQSPLFTGTVRNPWRDGIDRRTISEVLFTGFQEGTSQRLPLLNKDGTVNLAAFEGLERELHKIEHGRKIVLIAKQALRETGESDETVMSKPQFADKWRNSEERVKVEFARLHLQKALEIAKASQLKIQSNSSQFSSQAQRFIEHVFTALTVIEAIPDNSPETGRFGERFLTKTLAHSLSRPELSSKRPEANNLDVNSISSAKRSSLQTDAKWIAGDVLKKKGVDVSALDPVESGLWRKPRWNISEFDLTNYNKMFSPKGGVQTLDPSFESELVYKPSRSSGKTPKLSGIATELLNGTTKKQSVKLKFSVPITNAGHGPLDIAGKVFGITGETRSEAVANNIASALGFTITPTYYKKAVKLFLESPDKQTIKNPTEAANALKAIVNYIKSTGDLSKLEELNSGYDLENPGYLAWVRNIENVLSKDKLRKDSKKGWYIRITDAALEFKSDVDSEINVGSFSQFGLGREFLREHRASLVLRALLGDSDIKQVNSEVRLTKTPGSDGQSLENYQLVYSLADLGCAFGSHGVKNAPNEYMADILFPGDIHLNKKGEGSITLNYRTNYTLRALESVTLADAKWLLRRMAQFNREQLLKAFLHADYPEVVANVLTDKFLNRRDQLIRALFPSGLTAVADANPNRQIQVQAKTHFDPKTYSVSGHESCIMRTPGRADVVPCETVPSDYALSLSARFFKTGENGLLEPLVDGYGRPAPQNRAMEEVNGKKIEWALKGLKSQIRHIAIPIPGTSRPGKLVTGGAVMSSDGLKIEGFVPFFAQVHNPVAETAKDFPYWNIEVLTFMVPYFNESSRTDSAVRDYFGFDPGLAIRASPKLKIGQAARWVTEFVRVTPSSLALGLPDLPNAIIDVRNKQPFARISDTLIDGLKKAPVGSAIFSNHYLDIGGKFKVNPSTLIPFLSTTLGLAAPGAQVDLGGHWVNLKGLGLVKSDDSTILAVWDSLNKLAGRAGVGVGFLTEHFPIFQADAEILKRKSPVYAFNIENQDTTTVLPPLPNGSPAPIPDTSETVILKKHLSKPASKENPSIKDHFMNKVESLKAHFLGTVPSKDDKEMAAKLIEVITTTKKSRGFMASVLGFISGSRNRTDIVAKSETRNEKGDLEIKSLFTESLSESKKETLSGASTSDSLLSDVKANAVTREVVASFRIDAQVKFSEPKHMDNLYRKYGTLVPAEFEWLHGSDVSRYMGSLRLQSLENFNNSAIEDLFRANPTRLDVCKNTLSIVVGIVDESAKEICRDINEIFEPIRFAQKWSGLKVANDSTQPTIGEEMLRSLHFMIRTFSGALVTAREHYNLVMAKKEIDESEWMDMTVKIRSMVANPSVRGLILHLMRAQVVDPKKSIRREVLLTSSLGGLAGEDAIELHMKFQGREATSLDIRSSIEDLVPTPLDIYRLGMGWAFYDYYTHEHIKKRRGTILPLLQFKL